MSIDRASVQRWLDAYVHAWETYDPDEIRSLFTEDAEYRYHPYDAEPVRGADAIAASWVEDDRIDPPGTYAARYEPAALDGDTAVAVGTSRYYTDATRATLDREFHNCYVMRFAPDGRCRSFTEWYMRTP